MEVVKLIYRKPRDTGNFSIEASFDRVLLSFTKNSNLHVDKFTSSYLSVGFRNRLKAIWEVQQLKASIYHVTGDVHFLTLGLPKKKTILTIHDLGFLEDYSGLKRLILKWFWLDLPVRKSRFITTVSRATLNELIKHSKCPPEKIRVIPTLIKGHFRKKEKSNFPSVPTILHIGMAPNKNFRKHVAAIKDLSCKLLIIGCLSIEEKNLLKSNNIDYSFKCNLADEEMQKAYEAADLLLFASTLEGFGMPIIEAQTVGCPVVTSNLSSMPEVAGDAACLVNPYSVQSIREGVQKVIQDEVYRNHLVEKGFKNVQRFQPEVVAKQYCELYQELLKENSKE